MSGKKLLEAALSKPSILVLAASLHLALRSTAAWPADAASFQPIPAAQPFDLAKVRLGERLFAERRLSSDGSVSCATCHNLAKGGTDGLPRARGIGGKIGPRNTPTIFNAALNFRQFWDGRARTLEEQIDGPLTSPLEMASSWSDALGLLAVDATYVKAFEDIYKGPATAPFVRDALATYERTLLTRDSRFDRFLRGEAGALSRSQLEGFTLFKELGCVSCHQGVGIGGNMFQEFGVLRDYFKDHPGKNEDLGRFNVTKDPADKHVFKVPSLRNVASTAPYFHDGSAATLDEAVRIMGRYQLGREIPTAQVAAIVDFLATLTGYYQRDPR